MSDKSSASLAATQAIAGQDDERRFLDLVALWKQERGALFFERSIG